MLSMKKIDKLMELIGAVKPSDLEFFIKHNDLGLDEFEMWEILWELYKVLEKC